MYLDGCRYDTPSSICNAFAKHFSSVYVADADGSQKQDVYSDCSLNNILNNISISEVSIERALKELDPKKGAGPDGIPPTFLRSCASALSYPLYLIFSHSLSSGNFPTRWKEANVLPIPKTGVSNDVRNYRPISLLSGFSKLFEALVCQYFANTFKSVLASQQHGFRQKMSTVTNLSCFITDLSEELDRGRQVDAIYTDISKAFDKVNHIILLKKLHSVGVHGSLLNWCRSYLVRRCQKVVACGYESSPFYVPSGVPQGSHLGPIFFLIFINDLVNVVQHSECLLFADDLKVYKTIENFNESILLQQDLNRIAEWSSINKLPLNPDKCKHIKFTKKRNALNTSYSINSHLLEEVSSIRDLGVVLDHKLSFRHHYDHIIAKSLKLLGFIWRNCKRFKKIDALKDRLDYFKFTSLEDRRWVADQVLLYKIVNSVAECPKLLSNVKFKIPRPNTRMANNLRPGTWYEIRVVARSAAGDTAALYRAATHTANGERLGEPVELPLEARGRAVGAAGVEEGAGAAPWRGGLAPLLLAAGVAALLAAVAGLSDTSVSRDAARGTRSRGVARRAGAAAAGRRGRLL
ncbi:unnamed protein product [Chilo suppressalis]|uniref:Reverse transcriptase domain-containing protein n=1 Tax=Chilo suppressalis TaxID=168631 RepID=A0ABN8B931_CHISP|nr:unnamed protein product [Chilo suppressalis]